MKNEKIIKSIAIIFIIILLIFIGCMAYKKISNMATPEEKAAAKEMHQKMLNTQNQIEKMNQKNKEIEDKMYGK